MSGLEHPLPPGWCEATIGDLVQPQVRQGPPETSVQYIEISGIDRAKKQIVETASVDSQTAPSRARQWTETGDVLVSLTRPNLNAVALVPASLEGAVASTGFDVLRARETLPEWLFYRVRSQAFVEDVCNALQGVVYPAIRPRDVRGHRLPLPPRPEQSRIVSALDSHFSRLDEAEAGLERVQRNLKRYRASVLQAAVSGRLVPTEAELARAEGRDYEPASELLKRILVERRKRWEESGRKGKYVEPAPPDTSGLPELPEGWCWATVEMLHWDSGYGTSQKCSYEADGPPVLRIPNVQDQTLHFQDLKFATLPGELAKEGAVRAGDFLFIRTNGSQNLIGRGAVANEDLTPAHYFASYLIRLRLVPISCVPSWFSLAWHTPVVRSQLLRDAASSAGQFNVSLGAVRSYAVPLPPLNEQRRVLDEVETLMSLMDNSGLAIRTSLGRCSRLRQSILKWAFEGKLVDQDSSDEPASELLRRVQAERGDLGKRMVRGKKTRVEEES